VRATVIVIDSFGIGELPDASKYGDTGSNTAMHISQAVKGDKWPVLKKLGLGNASMLLGNKLNGCEPVESPLGSYGVMKEKSPGKDTTTGQSAACFLILKFTSRISILPAAKSASSL